jgi:hypothetical protein
MLIFNHPTPRLTQEAWDAIKGIGDWFIDEHYTYIIIYGCDSSPHLLPKYIQIAWSHGK